LTGFPTAATLTQVTYGSGFREMDEGQALGRPHTRNLICPLSSSVMDSTYQKEACYVVLAKHPKMWSMSADLWKLQTRCSCSDRAYCDCAAAPTLLAVDCNGRSCWTDGCSRTGRRDAAAPWQPLRQTGKWIPRGRYLRHVLAILGAVSCVAPALVTCLTTNSPGPTQAERHQNLNRLPSYIRSHVT
jgi:hypothetical protein